MTPVKCPTGSWELKVAPTTEHCFYIEDSRGVVRAVGDDPCVVATLGSKQIDPVGLYEDLCYGFHFEARTLFEGVRRLRRDERIVWTGDSATVQRATLSLEDGPGPEECLEQLARLTANYFEQGYALELSGGRDSRVLLAMGAALGVKPKLAITIGQEDCPDVAIARCIAESFRIKHYVFPIRIEGERLVDDANEYVSRSGYLSNACAYAWMPAMFRSLDHYRTGQVTGQAGAIVGGFYYTQLDPFIERTGFLELWIRLRLEASGNIARRLFTSKSGGEWHAVARRDIRRALRRPAGSWRERLDDFYRTQRMEMWGYPCLVASSRWYAVGAPLVDESYACWARTVPVNERPARKPLHFLLNRFYPELLDLPFDDEIKGETLKRSRLTKVLTKVRKVAGRLRRARRAAAQAWAETAMILCQDKSIREKVEALAASRDLGLNEAAVANVLRAPQDYPQEIGALITAALALDALNRMKESLRERGLSIGEPQER